MKRHFVISAEDALAVGQNVARSLLRKQKVVNVDSARVGNCHKDGGAERRPHDILQILVIARLKGGQRANSLHIVQSHGAILTATEEQASHEGASRDARNWA